MIRESPQYKTLQARFARALENIGLEDNEVSALVGNLNAQYLEELMISSYALMKYLRMFLDTIQVPYNEGYKVPDLFTAIDAAVKPYKGYKPADDEAIELEKVSRAAYAWLKSFHMLESPPEPINPLRIHGE